MLEYVILHQVNAHVLMADMVLIAQVSIWLNSIVYKGFFLHLKMYFF